LSAGGNDEETFCVGSGRIRGRIVSARTGSTINTAGGVCQVTRPTGHSVGSVPIASDGAFEVSYLHDGYYQFVCQVRGYDAVRHEIYVPNKGTAMIQLELAPIEKAILYASVIATRPIPREWICFWLDGEAASRPACDLQRDRHGRYIIDIPGASGTILLRCCVFYSSVEKRINLGTEGSAVVDFHIDDATVTVHGIVSAAGTPLANVEVRLRSERDYNLPRELERCYSRL